MEKRHKEIMGALVDRLRRLLIGSPPTYDFSPHASDELAASNATPTEQTAFTWLVRLLTLRALAARGLIAPQTEVNISASIYLFTRRTQTGVDTGLARAYGRLARVLPELFAPADGTDGPRAEILLRCLELLDGQQPLLPGVGQGELEATFADPDALGWAYQFYQAEARTAINARCRDGGKVATRAELIAKTQIFTEPYMVQWLLENSLGRCYAEAYPLSRLPAHWSYFIQPEGASERVFALPELTLLDPCVGGGHFLRAAFDLFVSLYREQHPQMSLTEIIGRVLSRHLFGIDLDPRAVQISVLTLVLRAWEMVRSEQEDADDLPPTIHLATIPAALAPGSLQRHLRRYPQDVVYRSRLEKIFAGLEQIDLLGSLLCIREYLDQAVQERPQQSPTACERSRQELLERIIASCTSEAGPSDPGRLHLLQMLDARYAVVATNPPYLDSRDMSETLRQYIAAHYQTGKRDLYAAFLLRSLDLCQPQGRVAVVTMQSWMFNRSFADLRATRTRTDKTRKQGAFTGLVRETCIEALVHLGTRAFEELSGEIVQCSMCTLLKSRPDEEFRMRAWRLIGLRSLEEKRAALLSLKSATPCQSASRPRQRGFLALAESPIAYYLSNDLMRLLAKSEKLHTIAHVRQGLATADNVRFTRCRWEVPATGDPSSSGRWFRYAKGGSYQKWAGLMWLVVDWEDDGRRIKACVDAHNRPRFRDNAPQFAFQTGLTYTFIASGSFGTRLLNDALFDVAGTSLFPKTEAVPLCGLAAVTSSHVVSYLLRILTQDIKFNAGYVANTPLAPNIPWQFFQELGHACIQLKSLLVEQNMLEDTFTALPETPAYPIQATLHTLEGWNESAVCEIYQLSEQDRQAVIAETGTPAGWYPLIAGYDLLPNLADELENAPTLPPGLVAYLARHERIYPTQQELTRLKAKLRVLYAAGPRTRDAGSSDEHETRSAEVHLPIPAETFLEGLSLKMQLHPISVYWLLEELRAIEDIHCRSEERRLLEDRLSVLILRLLGHRWPRQIAQFEPLPAWTVRDGIIPLVPCPGHKTLTERVRERLCAENAQILERRLHELTGQPLEQWLRARFFERHISQFKQRPLAWHLTSTPVDEKGSSRTPAFACLLYYHACTDDILTHLRTHYIEPLIQSEREILLTVRRTASPLVHERIRELEDLAARLRTIEEQGFACPSLQATVAVEVPDQRDRTALQRAEAAWQIDINDGVRVNIAPLQLAGVLAKAVLSPKDAHKALSDRAHWRADERRWVRSARPGEHAYTSSESIETHHS